MGLQVPLESISEHPGRRWGGASAGSAASFRAGLWSEKAEQRLDSEVCPQFQGVTLTHHPCEG